MKLPKQGGIMMNKLISISKKLEKVFGIAQTVLFALAVAAGAFAAMIVVGCIVGWDPGAFGEGNTLLEIGFLKIGIADSFLPSGEMLLLEAVVMLALCAVCFVIGHRGIRYIREILQPMSLGQPFNSVVSRNLRKLAWLGIYLGIAFNCVNIAEMLFAIFSYRILDLLSYIGAVQVTPTFTVDLGFLIYSALLFLLSYVFQYGEELQQLSDETL
jgi:hypothetical protein